MTKSTYKSKNCYNSLHNHDNVQNIVNNSNTHALEHTWQSGTNLVSNRNAPLEPFNSDLSLSVEFLQQIRNVAHACVEAQETSINVAREFSKLMDTLVNTMTPGNPPGIQLHSDVESTSHSRSMLPVVTRPRIVPVELSDHHSGIATSIPDILSRIKNHEPVAAATSCLGLVPDTNVHYICQRPATFDKSQAIPMAKQDRICDPTPIRKLSEVVVTLPIVAFVQMAMVLDTNAGDPATAQVNTAANAADLPSIDFQWNWEDRVAKRRLRNNNLQNSSLTRVLASIEADILLKSPHYLNKDLQYSGVSNIPNQGIGFNRSGYPVDKAHTPREVWDRREDMYPPQYTAGLVNQTRNNSHVSEHRKLQGGHSPPGGNGPPGDNGGVDGDGRDDKSHKGKKPAHCDHMPWDDSSKGESPPPPPPSSPPSSSEDSSLSDDNWIGAFAPNKKFLDKKVRCKLRHKAIKKPQARTDNNKRNESWLKGILREYPKQIRYYCTHEMVQSTVMPKGIKIPNPSRFTGSDDVEEFNTWLLALLQWIMISQLVGKVNDDQHIQIVGSFLNKGALHWYNNEVTGLHCSQLNWTFKKVILGLSA
ncbi:hypothetical protein BT96DRAFT_991746 [Gymnopus androsaceus JB14]|uniref:Uncharacterized protein n=1 Tax=Gymnopus androsaceus JB14 TaxID=1447944 RepID=A0A6A4HX25_9AGAR|nr:hypothetical protein BT96DRAFT_991746 [Gymnopus androsaceus JB14]